MGLYEELEQRGLLAQCTNVEQVRDMLNNKNVTFYIGFDPTADSLHVGHFLQMVVMSHMQKAGHRPIALFGGGTAMVGDPSGRTDMRSMMTVETIAHNVSCFKEQFERFIDFSDDKAIMVNNGDWLMGLNYIEFLRDVGVHFSVNRMLAAECFKSRLEKGLSFIEFNYMLMQSYDFLMLNNKYDCVLELGGDDQWSNILGGINLVRRTTGKEVYGMTFTLLTTSAGVKMGKTQKGAVWLDPNKTTPFEFYQYWRNIDDADVIRCMKMLTFIPLETIAEYEKADGSEINKVKEILAFELTRMIHGENNAVEAQNAARALFGGGGDDSTMPSTQILKADFGDEMGLLDIMVYAKMIPSKGEGRRLVDQGGVSVDGNKITDPNHKVSISDFNDGQIIIKKGKKVFHKIIIGE